MDMELMHSALSVLRACTERVDPRPEDVALLRHRMGCEAAEMPLDDMARALIQRSINSSHKSAANPA
jgi:hypothetical protein